jgi:hypothetical protein
MNPYSEEWRTIAEQASKEMDSKKLAALVNQLCCALMNATNDVGRHVDRLQSLHPQQIPHCPDRRCQTCLHNGRATDRGIHSGRSYATQPKGSPASL